MRQGTELRNEVDGQMEERLRRRTKENKETREEPEWRNEEDGETGEEQETDEFIAMLRRHGDEGTATVVVVVVCVCVCVCVCVRLREAQISKFSRWK